MQEYGTGYQFMVKIDSKVISVLDARAVIEAKIPLAKFVDSS